MPLFDIADRVLEKYMGSPSTQPAKPRLTDTEVLDVYTRMTPAGWQKMIGKFGEGAARELQTRAVDVKRRFGG